MNIRPVILVKIIAGFSLLVTAGISRADNSYFSFSFNYSNHGHYVHPYRYVYAPAYIYAAPSPFFFGYSSYYYPVFPYYYTPVVYYRPYLPYYYPYAYSPHSSFHFHYSSYRSLYPSSYVYGYYPYNRYYSYYPYKYYHYQPAYYRDHFHGRDKTHHKDTSKNQTVINKQIVKQNITNTNNQKIIITNATIEEQRKRELDKYRSSLQKNVQDNKPASSINKYYGRKPEIQSDGDSTKTNNISRFQSHKDNKDLFSDKSVPSGEKSNLETIERLINKKPELYTNNERRFQPNEETNHYKQYREQESTKNNTAKISGDQTARQSYLKNPAPAGNKITSRDTDFRQPIVRHNDEPVSQRQDRYRSYINERISLPQKQQVISNNFPEDTASSRVTGRSQDGPGENNRIRNSERGKFGGRNNEQNISFGKMRFE